MLKKKLISLIFPLFFINCQKPQREENQKTIYHITCYAEANWSYFDADAKSFWATGGGWQVDLMDGTSVRLIGNCLLYDKNNPPTEGTYPKRN
jgi:hypothetical protein